MRVLELGNYIAPAYCGMILQEQGAEVTKWVGISPDPVLSLKNGPEFWTWLNDKKEICRRHAIEVENLIDGEYQIVIDNFRPSFWAKHLIDCAELAGRLGVVWVSLRSEVGEVSFDILAQARSWMEYTPWVNFYAGDTSAGLWLAFKALAMFAQGKPGHYPIGHASCLQKLVEGELLPWQTQRPFIWDNSPWDNELYRADPFEGASVEYRGERYDEPVRSHAWKLDHLWHENGRMKI